MKIEIIEQGNIQIGDKIFSVEEAESIVTDLYTKTLKSKYWCAQLRSVEITEDGSSFTTPLELINRDSKYYLRFNFVPYGIDNIKIAHMGFVQEFLNVIETDPALIICTEEFIYIQELSDNLFKMILLPVLVAINSELKIWDEEKQNLLSTYIIYPKKEN